MRRSTLRPVWAPITTALLSSLLLLGPTGALAAKAGYTVGLYFHDPVLGIDRVGHNSIGDPINGDTSCHAMRPILCVNVDGSARPPYPINDETGAAFYNGWVEGHFARTLPIKGFRMNSRDDANEICRAHFGRGWRMAEFHDGRYIADMSDQTHYGDAAHSPSPWPAQGKLRGGWTMYGFGNLGADTRFWVAVNDQKANCWNR